MSIFSIKSFFNFRKTTASANASPIARPDKTKTTASANASSVARPRQTRAGDTQSPRRRQASSRTRRNRRSLFSRIVSSFTAIRKRNQNKAQIKTIRKKIETNMPNLKTSMPLKLQALRDKMEVEEQEISDAYITNFPSFKKIFTDEDRMTVLSESIKNMAINTQDTKAEFYSQHLIGFCGDDKNQASTLSTLLTPDTVDIVNQQLRKYSQKLSERPETGIKDVEMDVHMMAETARIVITQGLFDAQGARYAITVKTTIDVSRQNPSFIILDSVDITSTLR